METSFHYDLKEKQLGFKLRERLTAKPGLELKARAVRFPCVGAGSRLR